MNANNNAGPNWADTRVILHELEQLFNREDDLKDVVDIKKMQQEIARQSDIRLMDAKEIVKEMTTEAAAKASDLNIMAQADRSSMLKKIAEKKGINSLQIDSILKSIDAKKTSIDTLKRTSTSLQERNKDFHISSGMMDSRTAYAISLYAKISNITWDYNTEMDHLTGCVGNSHKKEVVRFDIDKSNSSSAEVAEKLWAIIGDSKVQ